MTINEVIKRHTLATLEAHDGNRTVTAGELGINVRTLQRWLIAWDAQNRQPSKRVDERHL